MTRIRPYYIDIKHIVYVSYSWKAGPNGSESKVSLDPWISIANPKGVI